MTKDKKKGKILVVLKKRKKRKNGKPESEPRPTTCTRGQHPVDFEPNRSAGLPSFKRPLADQPGTKDTVSAANYASDDEFFGSLACDTMLAIQNLTSNQQTCISIPLSTNNQYIYGILECQLQIMQNSSFGDTIVSSELTGLLNDNSLRILSSTLHHGDSLSVVVRAADYVRGVQDAHSQQRDRTDYKVIEWYVQRLSTWVGHRITKSQVAESWAKTPIPNFELQQVLQQLLRCNVLIPSHTSNSYQLWLPSWGTVLSAWEKARKKLVLQLKSSSYKERSEKALIQKYSPIPTCVLIDWLVAHGEVERIERGTNRFLRLPATKEVTRSK